MYILFLVFKSCLFHHCWKAFDNFLDLSPFINVFLKQLPLLRQIFLVNKSPHFFLMAKKFIQVGCNALLCNFANFIISVLHFVC